MDFKAMEKRIAGRALRLELWAIDRARRALKRTQKVLKAYQLGRLYGASRRQALRMARGVDPADLAAASMSARYGYGPANFALDYATGRADWAPPSYASAEERVAAVVSDGMDGLMDLRVFANGRSYTDVEMSELLKEFDKPGAWRGGHGSDEAL